jgi:ABC-type uncharacterized transport system permease subunit
MWIGVAVGALLAAVFGTAIMVMAGIMGAAVMTAYAFGQAVHDVRNGTPPDG